MRRSAVAVALVLAACRPSSQILLHVDTDATVPAAPDSPPRRAWLFDRLRIDVQRGTEVLATRDFAVDESVFDLGAASIGIAPEVDDGSLTARARLYRAGRIVGDQPTPSSALDTTVTLPALAAAGTTELTVRLRVEDVGRALGPIDAEPGPPGASAVGSWPGAVEVACAGAPGPDEVCIPGGAFLMGDPLMRGIGVDLDQDRERVVVLSPFFLDLHEVTVGELRAAWPVLRDLPVAPPLEHGTDISKGSAWCTYSTDPLPGDQSLEAMPVNCVFQATASHYCANAGKRLPSEAELEFVSSGRGAEQAFAWGSDQPDCAAAAWGRGGIGFHQDAQGLCRAPGTPGGPVLPGVMTRDRIVFDGGREIVDLAGNLSEHTRDRYQSQSDPYWSHPGVFHDPSPQTDSTSVMYTGSAAAGGFWTADPIVLRAAYRQALADRYTTDEVGFRCSRPGR